MLLVATNKIRQTEDGKEMEVCVDGRPEWRKFKVLRPTPSRFEPIQYNLSPELYGDEEITYSLSGRCSIVTWRRPK